MASEKERRRERVNKRRNIKVCKDGPYNVSGAIPLLELTVANDPDDCPYDYHVSKRYPLQDAYSLCRCGQSTDKPFCDCHRVIKKGFSRGKSLADRAIKVHS